jgi:hypothetical protein
MKKLLVLGLVLLVAAAFIVPAVSAVKPDKHPGIDFNGFHYTLNMHFKKNDWNPTWDSSSTDRSTMFFPEDTSSYSIYLDGCVDQNGDGEFDNINPITGPCDPIYIDGLQMFISVGEEWAVQDANCFDGECSLQLPKDQYKVYIVAKGKPGGETDIDGWVYYDYYDEELTYQGVYYFDLGSVNVKKNSLWYDITSLFMVTTKQDKYGIIDDDTWVFDYLEALEEMADTFELENFESGYFWQIVNNGNKLVKVRFYPV